MKFATLFLEGNPILSQLRLEEALLRTDNRTLCIISTSCPPAIVMGISGKTDEWIHVDRAKQKKIPIIKRFSGGGTVLIDPSTLFITLICNSADTPAKPQPKAILEWSLSLYAPIFHGMQLRENDFVFGEKKCAGNAQYIQKERWLLHTSFLWDYSEENMNCLKLPPRYPQYRHARPHKEFLCTLKDKFPSKKTLLHTIKDRLTSNILNYSEIEDVLSRPHRKSTEELY